MTRNKAKYSSGIGAVLGSVVFLIGIYIFTNRVVFLTHATSLTAPVVAVSHEYVPAGRGSVLAYVPTVQIHDRDGRPLNMKVDTSDQEPVYSVGQQMRVSCNSARGCIEDTFFSKWGGALIDLSIALLFFSPLLVWKFGLWQPDAAPTTLHLRDV